MAGGGILGALLLLVKTKADISGLKKTDKALKQTKDSMKSMSKDMGMISKLSKTLFGFVGIRQVGHLAGKYLQFEKDLGAMHSRFYAITKDNQKATEEFDYIRKLATDTALDIKSTADSYSIFYSATQKALGSEGARGVFEDWTKVGRVLHLSQYQMERVTYALREMASKGAIYSQDLRMQIGTHVPDAMGLAQKAAEEMGITGLDWFEKLQKQAKGNSKVTTEFVKLFSRQARLRYGSDEALKKALQQPDALAQMIPNIGYNFMVGFSRAGGSYMVVKILESIVEVLTNIDYNKITQTLGTIAHRIGDLADLLPQLISLLKIIALNYIITKSFMGLFKVFKFFGTAFMAFKQGNLLRWLLLKFGGPFGKSIVKDLVKLTARTGIRVGLASILKIGLRFIPIVGQIVTALSVLEIIAKLINKFLPKNEENKNNKFMGLDVSNADVLKAFRYIESNKNKIKSQLDLDALLVKGGYGNMAPLFTYNDNSKTTLTYDDRSITKEEAERVLSEQNDKKRRSASNFFNKPKTEQELRQDRLRDLRS